MIPRSLKPWSDDPNVHANFPISLLSTVTKKALEAKKGKQHLFEIGQTAAQKNISRLNQQFRPKKERKAYWKEILAPRDSADARFCQTKIRRVLGPCLIGFLVFRPFKIPQIVVRGIFAWANSLCTGILIAKTFNVDCRLLFLISSFLCAAKIFKESQ